MARWRFVVSLAGILLAPQGLRAQALASSVETRVVVDRALVRFAAPEIGGGRSPRFIFARELAFEARLEALADAEFRPESERAYLARHLHAASERHIAETLLAALRVEPAVVERELEAQAEVARRILLDRIGGQEVLELAARSEGMSEGDVSTVFRRRARAGIYLDRMVAPMLAPTSSELRQVYSTENHPYRGVAYEQALPLLRRWVVGQRLRDAFDQYYQNARQRLTIVLLVPLGAT
jgi:hypothetical protein